MGVTPDSFESNSDNYSAALVNSYNMQRSIVGSAPVRLNSILNDIRFIAQADLFDSEIDTAKELLKSGFLRASGAVAGVVLDKHLKELCIKYEIRFKKRKPMIGDYNDALLKAERIENTTFRRIQHFADLRALCVHDKDREPTKEEIDELIRGVDAIVKTVF